MSASLGDLNEPFELKLFIHQVGGHKSMLQLDKETIGKLFITQELNFYKTAPDDLKQFMPEYKGVIEVTFPDTQDGHFNVTSYMPPPNNQKSSRPISMKNCTKQNEHKVENKIKLSKSGNNQTEIVPVGEEHLHLDADTQHQVQDELHNPFVLCLQQRQAKYFPKSTSALCQKYLLLENRVGKYDIPCILDLKMGTRQYGDSATLAKKELQLSKAAVSTTSSLGVRLTGMAVYDHDIGEYVRHDKYYGVTLSVDGFHQVLYNFLHDGQRLRYQVITTLLEKLHKLYNVIQKLNTFRFFTSSLLIVYEGKKYHSENDEDKNVTLQLSHNRNMDEQEASNKFHLSSNCDKCLQSSFSSVCKNHPVDSFSQVDCTCSAAPVVDICMIDFAHSTHSEMPDCPVAYNGPDEGYLFGLENLIAQLESILQSEK